MPPLTLWLTGLSGSGKSTLAYEVSAVLTRQKIAVAVLDGDELRAGLCRDLGFSPSDRSEHVRRTAHTAKLLNRAGVTVVAALISPYADDRAMAKQIIGMGFREVYVYADAKMCRLRDPKGLYQQADAGLLGDFTGVSAPYEAPEAPDLVVDTELCTIAQAAQRISCLLKR